MSRVRVRLEQYKAEIEEKSQYKHEFLGRAPDIVNTLLNDLEQDEKENGWIPVSERLPEASGTYQVTCMDGRIYHSTYAKFQSKLKRWELTGARSYWKVTAWMPLPKPYKED
nr:MAG TPA: Protein of unknown function (DUF551) [Caudoviricetes sp.]